MNRRKAKYVTLHRSQANACDFYKNYCGQSRDREIECQCDLQICAHKSNATNETQVSIKNEAEYGFASFGHAHVLVKKNVISKSCKACQNQMLRLRDA